MVIPTQKYKIRAYCLNLTDFGRYRAEQIITDFHWHYDIENQTRVSEISWDFLDIVPIVPIDYFKARFKFSMHATLKF